MTGSSLVNPYIGMGWYFSRAGHATTKSSPGKAWAQAGIYPKVVDMPNHNAEVAAVFSKIADLLKIENEVA